MQLHHVYVCTALGAPEAESLLKAGLVEGSPNRHPGEGTANRRFFFRSGFLELLWVDDEREARSASGTPTTLWDRWARRNEAACPFGLCFSSAEGLGAVLPARVRPYRPGYLGDDRDLLFVDNLLLSEPEIFMLGWPQGQYSPRTEPTSHPLGLVDMRSVSVGVSDPESISGTMRAIRDAGLLGIHHSATPELVIEFTSHKEARHHVAELGLSLIGIQTTFSP